MDWTDIRLGNQGMKPEEAGGPQLDFPAITVEVVDSGEIAGDSLMHMLCQGNCQTLGKYQGRTQCRSSLTGTLNMKLLSNTSEPNIIIIQLQPLLTHEGTDKVSSYGGGGRVIESERGAELVQTWQQN